jgi:hypothetical protein
MTTQLKPNIEIWWLFVSFFLTSGNRENLQNQFISAIFIFFHFLARFHQYEKKGWAKAILQGI